MICKCVIDLSSSAFAIGKAGLLSKDGSPDDVGKALRFRRISGGADLAVNRAVEMTKSGKHGKPKNRLPTLPTLLGNPFGIPTASTTGSIFQKQLRTQQVSGTPNTARGL
jgi:hypothetical protein